MIRQQYLKGIITTIFFVAANFMNGTYTRAQQSYHELYRPQLHFSPLAHWMNDPNGMVYSHGVYHLFFQYYPDSTVWGPMHWGHAISQDMIHWKQQPIALYPDSIGYIFSGSAVIDSNNTSGFGSKAKPAMVAIFTQHNPNAAPGGTEFQNQSIAYSNDDGRTWIKYKNNPVIKNPGIADFRDPKVSWYEPEKKWIMILATKDRITFYSSPDLKTWKKESEFGEHAGAHGGVWECPDLFTISYNGKKIWVLTVSVNPGAPNKGSGTQYFTGTFDGKKFISGSSQTKWIDYGPDNYAGVTWNNTGKRKIFFGWMSNWMYAMQTPTIKWRSAMTLPRELHIQKIHGEMYVVSKPVHELTRLQEKTIVKKDVQVNTSTDFGALINGIISLPCRLDVQLKSTEDFKIIFYNDLDEKVIIGFDKKMNQYFIDRTRSGITDFNNDFAAVHFAPRISTDGHLSFSLVADESSVELFADDGLSVMTSIFFPHKKYDHIQIETAGKIIFSTIKYIELKSIWP